MSDSQLLALAQGRQTRFSVELMSRDGVLKTPLRTVAEAGALEYSYDTRIKSGGRILFYDIGEPVDWVHDRLRISVTVTPNDGPDREPRSWPMGVFLPTFDTWGPKHSALPVELHSRLVVLDEDALVESLMLPAGTHVIQAVRALIESNGEAVGVIEDSDARLTSDLVWEAGTPLLSVINDLLSSSGFLVLNTDREGQYVARPFVPPHLRPVRYVFRPGVDCIYTPDWSVSQDTISVPNRVVAIAVGSDTTEGLVGVATNEDPDSPFSYQSRKRWITKVYQGVEATSQEAVDSYALSHLVDLSSPTQKATLSHLLVPLDPYDAIELEMPDGTAGRFVVDRTEASMTATGLARTVLRRVVTYGTEEP